MPIEVLMPAASPTMKSGKIAKWLKKIGDKVSPGDVMLEIETDKATMEVDCLDSGVLAKIICENGSKADVGDVVALLQKKDEQLSDVENYVIKKKNNSNEQNKQKEEISAVNLDSKDSLPETIAQSSKDRIFASPLAKRIAQEKGVNIGMVHGTGPHGRVVKDDVENFKFSANGLVTRNNNEYREIEISTMKSVVASRLTESKQTIPHFYIDAKCNVESLIEIRQKINEIAPKNQDGKAKYKLSINDLIVKICAMAIAKFPEINASWGANKILQYNNVDVSVAVSIPGGLITPIVKNADQKSVFEISKEIKSLASRAKEGCLKPEEYQGGGFTISNLGMYGVDNFHAIINPPQSCILAVGGTKKEVIVDKNNSIRSTDMMTISISVDHRVIDGALAAEFISYLKMLLEFPALLAFKYD